jgi:hypothetical protein
MFLNRKLTQRKCGFKNIVPTAQFQDLGELDRFLMTDLGLNRIIRQMTTHSSLSPRTPVCHPATSAG